MSLEFRVLTGSDIAPRIDDLARLRMEVFRAFPYPYEGSQDCEARYLAAYARSIDSVTLPFAFDGVVVRAVDRPPGGSLFLT